MVDNVPLAGTTAEDRRALLGRGYEPIPLIGKRCFVKRWPSLAINATTLEDMEAEQGARATGTGLRAGRLVPLDIDLLDPDHAEAVGNAAMDVLGFSEYRREGRKGFVMLYRNTERPLRKITIQGKPPGSERVQGVEILGAGLQVAAFGNHPDTGKPYHWPAESPLEVNANNLPEVTRAQVRQAAQAVADAMVALDFEDVNMTGDLSDVTEVRSENTGAPVALDTLAAIMAKVDPDKEWSEWGADLGALADCRVIDEGGEAVEALDPRRVAIALDWSAGRLPGMTESKRWTGNQEVADTYDRMEGRGGAGGRTIGSLIKEAQANGYNGSTWGHLNNIARFYGASGGGQGLALAVDNTVPDNTLDEDDAPLSAAALDAGDYPRARHQWQGYLLESHVNTLDGDGGMGKTQAMLQIAVAVAAGVPLFGADTRQRPGLLVLCEDDYGETKARLLAICDARDLRLPDLPLDIWCRPGQDSTLAIIDDAGGLTPGPFLETLTRRLASYGEPVFLGLDPISDIAVMDETKRLPQNTLAKRVLGGFARDFGATVLLNRHPSKASMSDGSFYSGATSGNNAYRNRLLLKWRDPNTKKGAMTLEVVKSNYGLKGAAEIHHLNGVLDVLDKLSEAQRGELERGAVLDLIKRLLESGQTVVQDHGSGVKFRELSNMLRKEGFEVTRRDVEAYCRALAMAGRIHWRKNSGGKRGAPASWEIGPAPDKETEE